jgi:hypothetical protein
LIGGAGIDSITGGVGVDSLTGGAGADTFTFAANVAGAVVSDLATADTITDFVSGTDKLAITNNVTGAPTTFLGNFPSVASAQAAAGVAGAGVAGQAYYVTGDNQAYVTRLATGVADSLDTVINLPGVATLSAADFGIGAQGTGNTVALSAAAARVSTAVNTNASALASAKDDSITATVTTIVGSQINGGAGSDTLTISGAAATTGAFTGNYDLTNAANLVQNVEAINFAGATAGTLTMPDTIGLAVTNTSATLAGNDVRMGAGANQSYTATGTGANTVNLGAGLGQSATMSGANGVVQTVTLGGPGQSASTGVGNDVVNTSPANLAGSTIIMGTGATDSLDFTAVAGTATIAIGATAVTGGAAKVTGAETINMAALTGVATVLTITPGANINVTAPTAGVSAIAGTGSTITVAQGPARALTLSGTSNYAVSGGTTGNVTSTSTGTLAVTGSANAHTVSSTVGAVTYTGAALGATATFAGGADMTITGVGTVASAVYTENNTNDGDIIISTVDATASTITAVTGAGGSLTVNAGGGAGTAITTITALTAAHSSYTVNMTSTSAVTMAAAGTATAVTINATDANAHIFIADTNTASIETFTGGSLVDTVDLGAGGDSFTSGGGADVFTTVVATDTAVAVGFGHAAAVPTTAVGTSGMDVITGMAAGMTIVTGLTTASANALIRNGGTTMSGANAGNTASALLIGTYSSVGNTFTPSNAGTDSLLVVDNNGDTAAGGFSGIVLVGYTDALQNDTMAGGTFTSVAG